MDETVVGTFKRFGSGNDLAVIEVVLRGTKDESLVSPRVPGFEKIAEARPGDKVVVEARLIPPATSTQTHVGITKIVELKPTVLLDEGWEKKARESIEGLISDRESEVLAKAAKGAPESVHIDGLGTFYRRGTGWHGPGGYYGAGTELARRCEEKIRLEKGEQ